MITPSDQSSANIPASIVQSNRLIEARCSLTLTEQRIVLAMIAQVRREDDDLREIEINIAELARLSSVAPSSLYREVKSATKNLLSKPLIIDEEGGELQINWISSAQYLDDSGAVLLSFDKKLMPYLLKLRSKFTSINTTAISLTGQHSIRLYLLLKQYESIGHRTFTVEEFRAKMNIAAGEYKTYYDLKRRTIISPHDEFAKSDNIDIDFDFTEEKRVRKVTRITFRIFRKETQNKLDLEPVEDWEEAEAMDHDPADEAPDKDTKDILKDYGIGPRKAKSLIAKHGEDAVLSAIDVYRIDLDNGKVRDTGGGYLLALIEAGATRTPRGVMDADQSRLAKERAIKATAAKEKKEREESEEGISREIADAHERNLSWFKSLNETDADSCLRSISKNLSSPKMKTAIKSTGLEALSSPIIRSVFDKVVGELRGASPSA